MNIQDLKEVNRAFKEKHPGEIVESVFEMGSRPIITTNFRPYEVAILHLVTSVKPDIPVIWCDTGYNTVYTYQYAEELIKRLNLNVKLYVPAQTAAHREAVMGGIPDINDPRHDEFTKQVKLEPFERAMEEHSPDIWFTNLRKGQTSLRDSLDIVSRDKKGTLKVSPFFYRTDEDLDVYLKEHDLVNEDRYFDPTKVLGNRECGLHLT